MCDCIQNIDDKLAPNHCLNATMTFNGAPRRPIVSLIRRPEWKLETRRNQPSSFLCTYCPFCGEKYEEPDSTPNKQREA